VTFDIITGMNLLRVVSGKRVEKVFKAGNGRWLMHAFNLALERADNRRVASLIRQDWLRPSDVPALGRVLAPGRISRPTGTHRRSPGSNATADERQTLLRLVISALPDTAHSHPACFQ